MTTPRGWRCKLVCPAALAVAAGVLALAANRTPASPWRCDKPPDVWVLVRTDSYDGRWDPSGTTWPSGLPRQGTGVSCSITVPGRGTFSNSLTWTAPPSRLTQGQPFSLSMSLAKIDEWSVTPNGTAAGIHADYLFDEFAATVPAGTYTGVSSGDVNCPKGSCGGQAVLQSTSFQATFTGCSDDSHCSLGVVVFGCQEGADYYLRVYDRYKKQ
jgi:hypothetical protein